MAQPQGVEWAAFAFPMMQHNEASALAQEAVSRAFQASIANTPVSSVISKHNGCAEPLNTAASTSSPVVTTASEPVLAGLDLSKAYDPMKSAFSLDHFVPNAMPLLAPDFARRLPSSNSSNGTKRRSKDSADKPYRCLVEGCNSAFHQVCNLRTHEIVKHGRKKKFERTTVKDGLLKPYQCSVLGCTSAFLHAGNLRTHEIQKHGRPKKFSRKAKLESDDLLADAPYGRVQSEGGSNAENPVQKSYYPLSSVAKPFQCRVPGCNSSYSQAGNLRTHEVYKHGRPKKFTRNAKPDKALAGAEEGSGEGSSTPAASPLTHVALSSITHVPFDSKARTAAWIETLNQSPPSLLGLHYSPHSPEHMKALSSIV
ncbi:hypothetical protein CAPTEDRAFT_203545 [Capitella teleta]|uniref:C2H2-type domain-containing protein n=1 Tax=Capitella teleta TaxID=283909 RepID=R7UUA2_CAPTE|nr:hypothetical protein CAPTEDRAFT_203545 [Capitella teleta]|eukprot:ELU06976.1 hypothetical protein CAPTEDRAFT_203545 [Capitella teleta]